MHYLLGERRHNVREERQYYKQDYSSEHYGQVYGDPYPNQSYFGWIFSTQVVLALVCTGWLGFL